MTRHPPHRKPGPTAWMLAVGVAGYAVLLTGPEAEPPLPFEPCALLAWPPALSPDESAGSLEHGMAPRLQRTGGSAPGRLIPD